MKKYLKPTMEIEKFVVADSILALSSVTEGTIEAGKADGIFGGDTSATGMTVTDLISK